MTNATVRRNEDESRYELLLGEELAGYTEYEVGDGSITFVHTVVDNAHEGQGLGSTLAKGALTDAKGAGLRIDARCEFVASYLERHPELRS